MKSRFMKHPRKSKTKYSGNVLNKNSIALFSRIFMIEAFILPIIASYRNMHLSDRLGKLGPTLADETQTVNIEQSSWLS
jgi:hypothetical protein